MNTNNEVIDRFRGEHYFLSNFYPVKITFRGLTYRNNEAAFQSFKTNDLDLRKEFTRMSAPKAKTAGRRIKLRSDWENIKDQIMLELVRAKFQQNSEIADKLVNTGSAFLVERNNWGDDYWGESNGKGLNKLGQTLMLVRKELNSNKI